MLAGSFFCTGLGLEDSGLGLGFFEEDSDLDLDLNLRTVDLDLTVAGLVTSLTNVKNYRVRSLNCSLY